MAAYVLSVAAGVLIGVAIAAVAIALSLPFGLLGVLGYGLFTVIPPVGVAALVLVGVGLLLALLTGFAVVSVPVVTYLRYYALLVRGDTNADYDLIPGQRDAARSNGSA